MPPAARGCSSATPLVALCLPREKVKSINLVDGDAEVEYRRRAVSVSQLRRNCSKPYGGWAYRYDGDTGVEDRFFLHYGVTAIHLPDVSRRLSLVAVESEEVNAAFLSANDMRHSRWDTYKTVYTGLEAMEAAKAFRNYKDRFDLASFRVLTYERLRFLMLLAARGDLLRSRGQPGGLAVRTVASFPTPCGPAPQELRAPEGAHTSVAVRSAHGVALLNHC